MRLNVCFFYGQGRLTFSQTQTETYSPIHALVCCLRFPSKTLGLTSLPFRVTIISGRLRHVYFIWIYEVKEEGKGNVWKKKSNISALIKGVSPFVSVQHQISAVTDVCAPCVEFATTCKDTTFISVNHNIRFILLIKYISHTDRRLSEFVK